MSALHSLHVEENGKTERNTHVRFLRFEPDGSLLSPRVSQPWWVPRPRALPPARLRWSDAPAGSTPVVGQTQTAVKRILTRRFAPVVLGSLGFSVLPVLAELLGLGSYAILVMLYALLGVCAAALSALAVWFVRDKRSWLMLLVAGVTLGLAAYPCLRLCDSARRLAFSMLAHRSRAVVGAVDAYVAKHGRPPRTLNDLIPEHLEELPSTGMLAYPEYEYSVPSPDAPVMLYWYDLGPRNGAAFQGLWKYPDGNRDHAILVLTTSRDEVVQRIELDRVGDRAAPRPFDSVAWRREPSAREPMTTNFKQAGVVAGRHLRDVLQVLGPTDGERVLLSAPWELLVSCSRGGLNWDVFVYWPGQRYPAYLYGGSIERIGDWAYVHE